MKLDKDTEDRIKGSFIDAKFDELHYRNQIHKYLKHLEHIYKVGKLEDETKAFHTENSLRISSYEIEKLKKEIKELCQNSGLDEWRTFDLS